MTVIQVIRLLGPPLLALAAAFAFDRALDRRRLTPPGLSLHPWRRSLAFGVVAAILYGAVFLPLGAIGVESTVDLSHASTPRLFLLHGLLVTALAAWLLLGYAGLGEGVVVGRSFLASVRRQLGFEAASVPREIGIGLATGIGAWVVVLTALIGLALALAAAGAEGVLPKEAPAVIPWIAGLPLAIRFLVSLSAGVVEETFFRGFLQPRIGIALSTTFFVLAHFTYQQPFMLLGIAVLSLIYAFLVRWRQSVWAAIAAHALFDGVQLLVVIPALLKVVPGGRVLS